MSLKTFLIVFHNGSNYDYYFIIKELAEEFLKKINLLGEITEKYITFTVPIKKEVTKIDKIREQITKHISYILQLIDSTRFIVSSLSLVKNLSQEIHRIKCKYRHNNKKCETCEIKHNNCDCFHQNINFKDNLIELECLCCNKDYQHNFDEKLKKRFFKTYIKERLFKAYKLSNCDNNNFILLLRQGVYPYEYIDDWEKFNETSLPQQRRYLQSLKYARYY